MTSSTDAEKDMCIEPKPQAEHKWLEQLLGDWTFEASCDMGSGQPEMKTGGQETFRALGEVWVIGDAIIKKVDGSPAYSQMTLGFNPDTKKFIGSWVGSMMTHQWIYEGELDEARKVLTLNSEGPSFANPTILGKYQDIIEFRSADERVLRSQTLGDDGKWVQFMEAIYKRTTR